MAILEYMLTTVMTVGVQWVAGHAVEMVSYGAVVDQQIDIVAVPRVNHLQKRSDQDCYNTFIQNFEAQFREEFNITMLLLAIQF